MHNLVKPFILRLYKFLIYPNVTETENGFPLKLNLRLCNRISSLKTTEHYENQKHYKIRKICLCNSHMIKNYSALFSLLMDDVLLYLDKKNCPTF